MRSSSKLRVGEVSSLEREVGAARRLLPVAEVIQVGGAGIGFCWCGPPVSA
jgi:hypothetical protein